MENIYRFCSPFLDSQLTFLGFSKNAVHERVDQCRIRSNARTLAMKDIAKGKNIESIIVGSRLEGTALLSSDTDVLRIDKSIVCHDESVVTPEVGEGYLNVKVCKDGVPSGYVLLKAFDSDIDAFADIKDCFVPVENSDGQTELWLSADRYMGYVQAEDARRLTGWTKRNTVYPGRKGPSVQKVVKGRNLDADLVAAVSIACPDDIQQWQERERHQDWPDRSIIEAAGQHKCYAVPIGFKGHPQEEFHWRLCFTETELALVHSMTDTQFKILISLKLLSSHYLSKITEDISSYVIKNTMFWLLERHPESQFRADGMLAMIIESLQYLHTAVSTKQLPMYMLPGRNLFDGKLTDTTIQQDILIAIKTIINRGPMKNFKFMNDYTGATRSIQHTMPMVSEMYGGLLAGKALDEFNVERMKALDERQLAEYHKRVFFSRFSLKLYWLDARYIHIPYIRKFGLKKFVLLYRKLKEGEKQARRYTEKSRDANPIPSNTFRPPAIHCHAPLFAWPQVRLIATDDPI